MYWTDHLLLPTHSWPPPGLVAPGRCRQSKPVPENKMNELYWILALLKDWMSRIISKEMFQKVLQKLFFSILNWKYVKPCVVCCIELCIKQQKWAHTRMYNTRMKMHFMWYNILLHWYKFQGINLESTYVSFWKEGTHWFLVLSQASCWSFNPAAVSRHNLWSL